MKTRLDGGGPSDANYRRPRRAHFHGIKVAEGGNDGTFEV